MKRMLPLVLFLLAASPSWLRAADSLAEAAALAAQKDAEENYKRLSADIKTILDNQEVLQKRQEDFRQRLDKLVDEIRSVKDDHSRASGNYATRDDLRKYVEKLKELDEKRESDKKVILENIKALGNMPMAPAPEPKVTPRRVAENPEEMPYVYVVKKNDRLLDIIAAYNEHFQKIGQGKVTKDQVLKANPGLKPDHLVTGHKIHIPVPGKDSGKDNK